MAPDYSPPHGFTVNNAFTSSVYRDVYAAIDPPRPELSQKGKVVMVTGASRGIGAGIALTMAKAEARAIVITARRTSSLAETEAAIKASNSTIEVLTVSLEATDETSVRQAFETISRKYSAVDVLVNNAGLYGSDKQFLASADTAKWWGDFEVNVKGTMLVTRAFLSQLRLDQKSSIITLTSGAGFVEVPGGSAYSLTKLVTTKFVAHLAAEHPNVRAVGVHPGAVVNWATSEEADFLQGRYISSNWDVTELIARKDEIVKQNLLKVALGGLGHGRVAELKL